MKKKKNLIIVGVIACLVSVCTACSGGNGTNSGTRNTPAKVEPKQLNISFLIDLSDRIDPKNPKIDAVSPTHAERDMAIISHFVKIFKENMQSLGAYDAKGKMQVLFYPAPLNPEINQIASELKIDLAPLQNIQKKNVYDSIDSLYAANVGQLYGMAIKQGNYTGSDIWGFFKKNVDVYCIERDTAYRNILVILTDGYLYDEQTAGIRNGNRYAKLTASNLAPYRPFNQQKIDNDDFGLICPKKDLGNLEVLMLEVTPSKGHPQDSDLLEYCIGKWFAEMGVGKYKIYETDLPSNTQKFVDYFLK